jgi:uncharacterized DUF497 family protein
VRYEWDENKNRANQAKHGVSFKLAELVFLDPERLEEPNQMVDGETRLQVIGMAGDALAVLLVVFTEKDTHDEETIRIISARKANREERGRYSSLR